MKTALSLLALVSLHLTAVAATDWSAEVYRLPAVTVEIPRFTAAEKSINTSLAAMCADAGKLAALEAELRLPRATAGAHPATAPAPAKLARVPHGRTAPAPGRS